MEANCFIKKGVIDELYYHLNYFLKDIPFTGSGKELEKLLLMIATPGGRGSQLKIRITFPQNR